MARQKRTKKGKKVLDPYESVYHYVPPILPKEPPDLLASCRTCKKEGGLKIFVIIEDNKKWNPPHAFDTFCTSMCAREWNRPCGKKDKPPKIIQYKKWPDKKVVK